MLESGTCSVWRCTVCGEVWIWRNTPDGARAVTDIRLIEGRRTADDRYEFDAEYEVQCLALREPMSAAELQRMAESMRAQGRQQEWEQMEARRKASEQFLAERVSDMKPGDRKWFRDTFKLVRMGDSWIPEDMAERMKADRAAAEQALREAREYANAREERTTQFEQWAHEFARELEEFECAAVVRTATYC